MVVAIRREVGPFKVGLREVPARKHPYDRPVAGSGINFLALERVPDPPPPFHPSPDAAQARSLFAPDRDQHSLLRIIVDKAEWGPPTVRRRQPVGKLTEEVVFTLGDYTNMCIVTADQARLGSLTELRVQLQQSQLERGANVTPFKQLLILQIQRLQLAKINPPALQTHQLIKLSKRQGWVSLSPLICVTSWSGSWLARDFGISPVHWFPVVGLRRVHQATAQVAVVRDSKHLAARVSPATYSPELSQ